MSGLLQDLRYGVRMMFKQPGFTAAAVLTLAFGIGANTAIFSVVNAVLLKPLPYTDSDRLVQIWSDNQQLGNHSGLTSLLDFNEWKQQSHLLENMGAYDIVGYNLWGNEPERITTGVASHGYFEALGVKPFLGRLLQPDDEVYGNHRVGVMSYGLWQRRFASDPNIVGKTLTIDGFAFKIIGVLPPDFNQPVPGTTEKPDWWRAFSFRPEIIRREDRPLKVIARLKPGVTLKQAQAEMDAIARRIADEHPETNAHYGVRLVPLQEQAVGNLRQTLFLLLGAVSFVLLIACANVANLLLTRSTIRQKEMAVRAALGARRGRIVRQLLTESLLISLLGGALGVGLGVWGIDLLLALGPADLPRLNEVSVDVPVLGFTLIVSLLTGVLFGLAPALQASKFDLNEALKESAKGLTRGVRRDRVRSLLVVSEVALSLILLVAAGLMMKSFTRLLDVDPGFRTQGLLTMQTAVAFIKYSDDQKKALFIDDVLTRIAALPGVQSAAAVEHLPLKERTVLSDAFIEGRSTLPDEASQANHQQISPDYFHTMGVNLLRGRAFTKDDRKDAPGVAIIDDSMARRFWGDADPIGQRVSLEKPQEGKWLTIIGVAANVRQAGLDAEPTPEIYTPIAQGSFWTMNLVIRTDANPEMMTSLIRKEILAVDKDQPIYSVKTMAEVYSDSLMRRRFSLLLFILFGGVAVALAAVGVYSVMSYSVAQRTQELGIRIALGADHGDVIRLILKEGSAFVFSGVLLGVFCAWGLTRLMVGLLYGVQVTDATTFFAAVMLMMVVGLLACYIPARRATKVDPMVALRHE